MFLKKIPKEWLKKILKEWHIQRIQFHTQECKKKNHHKSDKYTEGICHGISHVQHSKAADV